MRTPNEIKAFEELYRRHAGDVFRFSLYLSGNRAVAQDVTSETFVRAWTAKKPVQTATAKAYLFAIARNLYVSSRRRAKPEIEAPAMLAAPDNQAESYEHRTELAETLEDLALVAEGDRAALVMAVFEEMSYDEVARALGIGAGAVKARVFRARMRLIELRNQKAQRRTS